LIELGLKPARAEGFQKTCRTKARDIAGVFGNIETDADVTLGSEVINFIGLCIIDDTKKGIRVTQVTVVECELVLRRVRINKEMFDATAVKSRSAPDKAVHLVPFLEQQLYKVRAVLACDASDECAFGHCMKVYLNVQRAGYRGV
jgi:hypothetical protein